MTYYIERLQNELKSILNFWLEHAIIDNRFATQVSIEGCANFDAPLGSLYVSRVLYGTSAAARFTGDQKYKEIADLAYQTLRNQLSNPAGGYYWAVNENTSIIHDSAHISFAQAFVLYGLAEYYAHTPDQEVKNEMFRLVGLIESKIRNVNDLSYSDDFDQDWNPLLKQNRSLGTHLHLLEAYSKYISVTGNTIYKRSVEQLIQLLLHKFVSPQQNEVFHLFNSKWNLQPNETWIGHNVEAGWIIYNAAVELGHKALVSQSRDALLNLCENAIDMGFDKQYGGMFNRFIDRNLISSNKEWWPQAESVVAFLTCYHTTHDKKFLSYAIRLLEYIDNTISDSRRGEWYDTVSREGKPLSDQPKLHLWKSMYHNVRYCLETIRHLEKLFVNA